MRPTTRRDGNPCSSAFAGEDDLILQKMTDMGYRRDESLAALEKYDYNIDEVVPLRCLYYTFASHLHIYSNNLNSFPVTLFHSNDETNRRLQAANFLASK